MLRLKNETGADVGNGKCKNRMGGIWLKRASALFFYPLLERVTDVIIPIDTSDFRLMSKRVTDDAVKRDTKANSAADSGS